MKPVRGENPPLRSSSRSQIWRGVRSHEGKSRDSALASAAYSGLRMRLTSSPPCGGMRWLCVDDVFKCDDVWLFVLLAGRGSNYRARRAGSPHLARAQTCTVGENGALSTAFRILAGPQLSLRGARWRQKNRQTEVAKSLQFGANAPARSAMPGAAIATRRATVFGYSGDCWKFTGQHRVRSANIPVSVRAGSRLKAPSRD